MSSQEPKIIEEFQSLRTEMQTGLAEHNKRHDSHDSRFDWIDQRFDSIDKRFELVDKRFDKIEARLDGHDKRLDRVDLRLDAIEEQGKKTGLLLEDVSDRMDRAAEGIDSILTTMNRLIDSTEYLKDQVVRTDALEIWCQAHQRAHDEGKL
jgi:chromosome segregation ATPase